MTMTAPPAAALSDFRCNVCGHSNSGVVTEEMRNRECQSCRGCGSSLRMRSVVRLLSHVLYGRTIPAPDFPVDKSIAGLGMSDWDGYAARLAQKFDYVNTFYHAEPRLDITAIPDSMAGKYRFLISSDVFEHIPPEGIDAAFRNSRRLLRRDGAFIFTVPYLKTPETKEHFPRLHDFRIVETNGKRVLHNRTADGQKEIFEDLIFHGGEGMTLEMRMFGEADLLRRLREAGFSSVRICPDSDPAFGVDWPIDFHLPILARP